MLWGSVVRLKFIDSEKESVDFSPIVGLAFSYRYEGIET
jgi:hypothetical protein